MKPPSIPHHKLPRHGLTNKQWRKVAHFFTRKETRGAKPRIQRRFLVHAIFWILRTGAPWRDLHPHFPNWKTVYHYFREWTTKGLLSRIYAQLLLERHNAGTLDHSQWNVDSTINRVHKAACGARKQEGINHDLGRSKGGLTTKIHFLTEAKGIVLGFVLSPGQAHDCPLLFETLDSALIKKLPEQKKLKPERLVGDKGYDSRANRRRSRQRGIEPVIAHKAKRRSKKDQGKPTRGRPTHFDKEVYKRRHVIENTIGHLKEFRRLAFRFEKLSTSYKGMIFLANIERLLRS